ncbi:MAG: PEP-utilizing enzyme [Nitrososphaerales archaeon]
MSQGGHPGGSEFVPIKVPKDFPVQWEDPNDQRLFWTHDRIHNPEQLMALEEMFIQNFIEHGFNAAAEYFGSVMRAKNRIINTFSYSSRVPTTRSAAEMQAQTKRSEEKMELAISELKDTWDKEFFPEIQGHIEAWESFAVHSASLPDLILELERTLARARRLGEIHFRITGPMNEARSRFEDFYEDLFGKQSGEVYRLLQGFDNKSLETNRELWNLSRHALASQEVHKIMKERALDRVIEELEAIPQGRDFLVKLRDFLEEYGRRSDRFSLHEPSWIDEPKVVIEKVRQFMTAPDRDKHDHTRLASEREESMKSTRKQLAGYPKQVIEKFDSSLGHARIANTLQEDHAFWIDNMLVHNMRKLLLEFGKRFSAAGVFDDPDDIWNLKLEELLDTARQFPKVDRRQLVRGRRFIIEQFRSVSPPHAIGSRRVGPRPDSKSGKAVVRFMGRHATQAPSDTLDDPSIINGQAASAGTARGPACVCHSLAEAAKLKSGDVLVAETTLPPWTHLFAIASAIVTDVGGILSHCAVVAREYGIPAVVDTGVATSSIKEGQLIEVNGDSGIVKIVE